MRNWASKYSITTTECMRWYTVLWISLVLCCLSAMILNANHRSTITSICMCCVCCVCSCICVSVCASVFLLLLHFFVICRECCCLFLYNVHRFDFDYSMTIFAIDCVSDCHSVSSIRFGSCMSVAHYHCRQRVEWIFVQIEITSANIGEHHFLDLSAQRFHVVSQEILLWFECAQ